MTFAQDIENVANGEPIVGIVIGAFGWGSITDEPGEAYSEHHAVPMDRRGIVLTWEEARPLLDYEYDQGYGAPDCHAITAWTTEHVIWVTQYDGATGLDSARRNPIDHKPQMPGG